MISEPILVAMISTFHLFECYRRALGGGILQGEDHILDRAGLCGSDVIQPPIERPQLPRRRQRAHLGRQPVERDLFFSGSLPGLGIAAHDCAVAGRGLAPELGLGAAGRAPLAEQL
jgi:hypothetical protein